MARADIDGCARSGKGADVPEYAGIAAPGALEALVESAGLTTERAIDVPTPFIYPDLDIATRGQLSSGPARMAINTAGLDATTAAVRDAMATGTQADGTIRLDNVFKIVVARA